MKSLPQLYHSTTKLDRKMDATLRMFGVPIDSNHIFF